MTTQEQVHEKDGERVTTCCNAPVVPIGYCWPPMWGYKCSDCGKTVRR